MAPSTKSEATLQIQFGEQAFPWPLEREILWPRLVADTMVKGKGSSGLRGQELPIQTQDCASEVAAQSVPWSSSAKSSGS